MNIIRIQDKVLNPERIHRAVDQILQLRQEGLSQQEVAARLNIDRTLISRLESLGEIRKGPRLDPGRFSGSQHRRINRRGSD